MCQLLRLANKQTVWYPSSLRALLCPCCQCQAVTPTAVLQVVDSCRHLTTLKYACRAGCPSLDAVTMQQLVMAGQHLQELDLSLHDQLDDNCLRALAGLPQLQKVGYPSVSIDQDSATCFALLGAPQRCCRLIRKLVSAMCWHTWLLRRDSAERRCKDDFCA